MLHMDVRDSTWIQPTIIESPGNRISQKNHQVYDPLLDNWSHHHHQQQQPHSQYHQHQQHHQHHHQQNRLDAFSDASQLLEPPSGSSCLSVVGVHQKGSLQLWRFLVAMLDDPTNQHLICWTEKKLEFKLNEPEEVARLWGIQKNRPTMNYDKLSRSLRYYYEKGIIKKVSGERYVYRFAYEPELLSKLTVSMDELQTVVCSSTPPQTLLHQPQTIVFPPEHKLDVPLATSSYRPSMDDYSDYGYYGPTPAFHDDDLYQPKSFVRQLNANMGYEFEYTSDTYGSQFPPVLPQENESLFDFPFADPLSRVDYVVSDENCNSGFYTNLMNYS